LSHGPHRIRSAELEFEAILNFALSPKVVIFAPDCGVAKLLPRLSVQPHLLPNALDCLRRVIGLIGVYTLTGAGYKKDFNKGMLLVARMEPYRGRQWGKTPRSGGNITQLLVREVQNSFKSELRIRCGPWLTYYTPSC